MKGQALLFVLVFVLKTKIDIDDTTGSHSLTKTAASWEKSLFLWKLQACCFWRPRRWGIRFPTDVSRCAKQAQSLQEALKKTAFLVMCVCVGLSIKHLCVAPSLPVLTQKPSIVKLWWRSLVPARSRMQQRRPRPAGYLSLSLCPWRQTSMDGTVNYGGSCTELKHKAAANHKWATAFPVCLLLFFFTDGSFVFQSLVSEMGTKTF